MDANGNTSKPRAMLVCVLCLLVYAGAAHASDQQGDVLAEPAYEASEASHAPWMQPIDSQRPIRRMTSLRHEYRRIRDLRQAQIQPEYERRLADGEDADAWRERTLREVARRDLRDLRARLDR